MNPIILELVTVLFLLMDPFGNMCIINNLLGDYERKIRRRIIFRESLISLGLLVVITFVGSSILNFLGLKESSLRIAGGIVLFLISIRMVFPKSYMDNEKLINPLIVPIAVPLIAGPSTLSMVILYSHTYSFKPVVIAVVLASILSSVILIFSPTLFKWMGERGAMAIERLMGMLLIMVSVQMILDGVKQFFVIS